MEYIDLTSDIVQKIKTLDSNDTTTTLKELLSIDSADKIYINYTMFHFPNGQWANQKEFLRDMRLTVKNNEKLIFSDTLTSFFIINKNEVYKQCIVQSKIIKFSPDWYDPDIAYLAGIWNPDFNMLSDSVTIYPKKMEIIVANPNPSE
ncbi:MAG TPA: hypothetical protein VKX31_00895 [Brumimicrobium sp.]|nr:hypothetical protein [Brumimicrobium sp.]